MPHDGTVMARRLRRVAAIIVVLGLGVAAFVYVRAGGAAGTAAGGYQIVGGQAYAVDDAPRAQRAETERMGGQALVMTGELGRWFDSLWHGRRLAWTLGVGSVLVGWLCWHFAGLMAEELVDEVPPTRP